jgi:predicted RNA-binding protein with PUA domain
MSAQFSYERYWDNLMDKDLAETIAAACCENCGRELMDDKCAECKAKQEEDETLPPQMRGASPDIRVGKRASNCFR